MDLVQAFTAVVVGWAHQDSAVSASQRQLVLAKHLHPIPTHLVTSLVVGKRLFRRLELAWPNGPLVRPQAANSLALVSTLKTPFALEATRF